MHISRVAFGHAQAGINATATALKKAANKLLAWGAKLLNRRTELVKTTLAAMFIHAMLSLTCR
jgi:hypothetical protein